MREMQDSSHAERMVEMYRYEFFRDDTGEYIETCTVDKEFKVVGERVGSVVIDDKDLPGTVTRIDNTSEMKQGQLINGRVWVKQDSYS